ncbi:MAG: ribonuclease M5 [Streptococcaceae bacterium]|nr:ribonuclease M5 [Streptococcaceae bacterium]
MEKKKIHEIIVVEGRDDTRNLKLYYAVDTYETNGSSINEIDIERLKVLHDKRGIIIFTDPDYQGERIRKIIMRAIPTAKHAFLNPSEAQPKSKTKGRSLGVEHAKYEDLEKALSVLTKKVSSIRPSTITQADLIRHGFILKEDSRQRREYLCKELRIGYVNGKQLLKRLNMFGIEKEEIEQVMTNYIL